MDSDNTSSESAAAVIIEPEVWTISEVCTFLRLSKQTVYKHVAEDSLPHRKVGRALRFIPAEVRAWFSRLPGKKKV